MIWKIFIIVLDLKNYKIKFNIVFNIKVFGGLTIGYKQFIFEEKV